MATAEQMVSLARNEVGYTEKNSGSDLYDGPAGSGNYTKYWKELTYANWFDGMDKQGCEWCAGFVCWLALKCTGSKKAGRELLCQDGPYAACCDDAVIYYKNHGRFFSTPEVGDQIFFDYDPCAGNGEDHTGIVESISGGVVATIEGNSHSMVSRNKYYLSDSTIAGYGRPLYDNVATSSTEVAKPVVEANKGLYEVVAGDTLWDIAQKYGCTVDQLVEWNNIDDRSLIHVGQMLNICGSKKKEDASSGYYTVVSGDTLWDISERYGVTVAELVAKNGIENPALIYPGQTIKL